MASIFGLDIRRAENNVDTLFHQVDRTLARHGMISKQEDVSPKIKAAATAQAIHKMMQPDRHLSVCTIREAAKLYGLIISKERMQVYQLNHCVDWNDMLPDLRESLVAMILDDFRSVLNPSGTQDTTAIITT